MFPAVKARRHIPIRPFRKPTVKRWCGCPPGPTSWKKAISHDTLGRDRDQPVTLTVKANDDNKQDVLIGVFVNVTVDKKEKVYFAKDSESPLNISSWIHLKWSKRSRSVKWFGKP